MAKYAPGVKGVLTPQDKETLEHLLARGWEPGFVVEVQESYVSYDGFDCILISWGQHKADWAGVRDDGFIEEVTVNQLSKDDQIRKEALEVTAQCLSTNSVERAMELLLDFYMALHLCVNVEETEDEETIAHYMSGLKLAKQKCLGICS